jgi:hypothetical protein
MAMSDGQTIYTAMVAAQASFGTVKKGSTNPAFKSKYADLADVASIVIPTLNGFGVAVFHYIVGDAMRTEFMHAASGSRIWCDVPLMVDKQNMQGMKSATTYAKRIGLESLSGIAPEDDDGNAAAAAPPRHQPAPPPAQASDGEKKAAMTAMAQIKDVAALQEYYRKLKKDMPAVANDPNVLAYGKSRKDVLQSAAIQSAVGDDAIPHMDPDPTATGFAT